MAHPTEAACLLESGALYEKRLGLRPPHGEPIFAGFKQAAFSLYFGDAPIFHFDLEGRWQRAFVEGLHYLKGLDTTVQTIDRVREGENLVLKRRTLSITEASDVDTLVRATALDLLDRLGSGQLERIEPPAKAQPLATDALRAFLEQIARWDAAAWFAHREKYRGTYGSLPLLPPDCLNAVVLQATLGHADGLTFGLAPAAEHYVRSAGEFDEHARTVAGLLGKRLLQCKNVFLAGSDVLRRPSDDVATYLDIAAREFPVEGGVLAFLDRFSTPRPGRADWRRFAERGLNRVSLGVESGDPEVRALYGKRWSDDDLRATVSDLKGAGLGVGVLTLVGAGGVEHAERHLAATADLINGLELGPGDLVSLLDANEVRAQGSGEPAPAPGFTPLTGPLWAEQQTRLREGLEPVRTQRKAKVAPYSLEKQGCT